MSHSPSPTPTPPAGRVFWSLRRIFVTTLLLLIIAFAFLPSPYALQQPGPVVNTLGTIEIEGEERRVIDITDVDVEDSDGVLNMLTVQVRGHHDSPLRMFELLPSLFRPGVERVPLDVLYPRGVSFEERNEANQQLMKRSQESATVAAMRALGKPVAAVVSIVDVFENGPSENAFVSGDVLQAIDGEPVTGEAQVRHTIGASEAGRPLMVTVERDGELEDVRVVPEWSEDAQRSVIGVTLLAEYDDLPVDVEIVLDRTGGPSAGMVFSLAIIESLLDEDLVGDVAVSGTGTMDDGGFVGAVGGVASKIEAASGVNSDLLLVPLANCSDLPNQAPEDMVIAPVETLDEALSAIRGVKTGQQVPGLERCHTAG